MRYRKKPVIVEVIQWLGWNASQIKDFCPKAIDHNKYFIIPVFGGEVRLENGDILIKGVAGEFYPCKPDIFEMTYEEIKDEKLKEELNNSKNYHCEHFVSTNNGYIACKLKYPDAVVSANSLIKAEKEIEELKKQNLILREALLLIVETEDFNENNYATVTYNTRYLKHVAREALKQTEG